jgi:hypothetical protein
MSTIPGAFAVILLLIAILAAVLSIIDVLRTRKFDRDIRRAFKEAKRLGLIRETDMRLSNNQTEYMNQLAEEFNAPYVEAKGDLPAVEAEAVAPVTPVIREAFEAIDSYPVTGTGLLQDRDKAPVLIRMTVKQAD